MSIKPHLLGRSAILPQVTCERLTLADFRKHRIISGCKVVRNAFLWGL